MAIPTLKQIIGTITGKVAFERTQENFTIIKDAHNDLETEVGLKASETSVVAVADDLVAHKAEKVHQYEEGNWTPTLSASVTPGNHTYGIKNGKYTKVGNKVTCSFFIILTKDSAMEGIVRIEGLPFSPNSRAGVSFGRVSSITFGPGFLIGHTIEGTPYIYLQKIVSGAGYQNLSASDVGNIELIGTITYFVN